MALDAPDSRDPATSDKDDLRPLVEALIEQIKALVEQNKALLARIAEFEARKGGQPPPKTPANSSLPPSKGQKANRPETAKKGRKGRPGVTRALSPTPDAPDLRRHLH